MSTLSRTTFPSHGWQFFQPQTNWTAPMPMAMTFDDTVDAIIKHRLANPYITQKHALSTDWPTVALELENFTRARLGMSPASVESTGPPPPKPMPRHPEGEGVVAGHARKTFAGIKVLFDWLGSGLKPVSPDLAEARAAVCVQCPHNQLGDFWQRLEAKVANKIRTLAAIKNDMDLHTTKDDELFSCMVCDCWMPNKVHVPLAHILTETDDQTKSELWENCWILHETPATG